MTTQKTGDLSTITKWVFGDSSPLDDSKEGRRTLIRVLCTIKPREMLVLGLRSAGGMTLQRIADQIGVTRERVRQIEAKALRKLRHPSRSRFLKDFVFGVPRRKGTK